MTIKVYIASVTASRKISKEQEAVQRILLAKKIEFDVVDIAATEGAKEDMRRLSSNPTALPPQIFNNEEFCGTFEQFEEAIEDGELNKFLKI